MRLWALTHPPLWGFFRLWAGGSTGSIVSWVMGHNSLFKEAAVTHMGRKTDSTETGFVPPRITREKTGSHISHSWRRSHLISDNNGHISGSGTNTVTAFLEKQARTAVPVPDLLTGLAALPPNDRCSCVLRLSRSPQMKGKGPLALL